MKIFQYILNNSDSFTIKSFYCPKCAKQFFKFRDNLRDRFHDESLCRSVVPAIVVGD